jgi:hypothetical protein
MMTAAAMLYVSATARANARAVIGALALSCLCACSSMDDYSGPRTLIPARQLNLSPSLAIPAEAIVAAGIIYAIVDPLAPNWKVQIEPLGARRYRVNMTMKRFFTGGEGESNWVFRRAAEKLQHEGGFAEYEILSYSEAIESKVTLAQRVASGVVELR